MKTIEIKLDENKALKNDKGHYIINIRGKKLTSIHRTIVTTIGSNSCVDPFEGTVGVLESTFNFHSKQVKNIPSINGTKESYLTKNGIENNGILLVPVDYNQMKDMSFYRIVGMMEHYNYFPEIGILEEIMIVCKK